MIIVPRCGNFLREALNMETDSPEDLVLKRVCKRFRPVNGLVLGIDTFPLFRLNAGFASIIIIT